MAHPGLGRRSLRAAVTTWALVGLLWCATTGPSGLPDGLLLPTVLAIVATAAVCLLLRHGFSPAFATVGPLGPVAERYRSTLIAWVGDPNIPGKPQPRAPGARPSLR
jgi:hypothetical protein